MGKLTDLAPPLGLCKKIPAGKFEDSVLVWVHFPGWAVEWEVMERCQVLDRRKIYPAPTLQEIMDALYVEADGCCMHTSCYLDNRGWEACVVYECHDDSGYGGDHNEIVDNNPATAALKLYLERYGNDGV